MSTVTVYDALVSLYTGMYNRAPDYEGLSFWQSVVEDQYGLQLNDPVTDLGFYRDLTAQFAQFPTFQVLYMNLTDTQFVNALYANLQNRSPEASGLAYWVGRLNGTVETPGDSREKVIADFIYGTLAADYSSPAFAGLDATTRADAQAAQDAALNKIAVGKYYVEIFGELSNYPDVASSPFYNPDTSSLTYTQDAANLQSWLQVQPQYQYATNSLSQVNESSASIDAGKAAVLNSYSTMTNPASVFTLTDVLSYTPGYTVAIDPIITRETYWGYNPHGHGETDVDNLDGNNPDGNDNNLTNEGPVDGGVPLSDLVGVITQYLGYQKSVLDLFDTANTLEGIRNITVAGLDDQLQGAGFLGPDGEIADGFTVSGNGEVLDGDGNVVGFYDAKTGDYTGNYEITVTLSDGNTTAAQVALSQQQFDFINGLLFDSEGNTRLFEVVITTQPQVTLKDAAGEDVEDADGNPIRVNIYEYSVNGVTTKSYAPIVLTPSANNGGTIESGFTTGFDDTIVAGRLELLHGAYIDGGAGRNTLEVDAKGYFAQPLQLLNIQQVNIQNLPNIYTLPADPLGTPYNPLEDSSYPELDPDPFASYVNSVIDLSRATSLDRIVITEGNYEGLQANHVEFPGTLTVNGIRNGAVARFEGAFDHDVNLNYSEGLTGPLTVELLIGMITANLNFAHNTDALHLVSLGGSANSFGSEDLGGRLTNLKISGDAALYINGDLDGSFQDETPITIDASANTGGVNLELTDSQNVTFIGSQGNDIFKVDTQEDEWFGGYNDYNNNSTVTIKGGPGNNLYAIEDAYRLDITSSGNGNNDFEVDWAVIANIQAGNGNNHFQIDDVQNATLVAGNGNNRFEVYAWGEDDTGYPDISYDFPSVVTITAGSGKNDIDLEMNYGIGVANITVGNGGNAIDVSGHEVKITSGTGPDVIKVLADVIKINSGGGGDTITLGGWDRDYVGTDELGGNSTVGGAAQWGDDGALVQVNTGTGPATIILGSDEDYAYLQDNDFPGVSSLTAMEGSFISGGAITLFVKTVADLRAATLTGVTRIILDDDAFDIEDAPTANEAIGGYNAAVLTLTATQFAAIGASKIGVDGAVFNTHAFIKIIVDQAFAGADGKVSLTELGVDSLSRNIDLLLEVQDGVELSMTAQQLHTRVAQHGVTLANDGNTDYVSGKVVITGGGADFDPFNVTDKVKSIINGQTYYGGSLSSDFQVDGPDAGTDVGAGDPWYNVTVRSSVNGYNRPADAVAEVFITLDSTGTATLEQGAFESWHTNLEIIGDQDITFTGAFGLGEVLGVPTNPFNIDFSALEGNMTNFVVDNFELLGQGGSITGNLDAGYNSTVYISIAKDVENDGIGFDEEDHGGSGDSSDYESGSLHSSGVSKYVVTTIDGPTAAGSMGNEATIKLCDTAQDIEVFALRGNYNDTLNLVDAAWGLVFELQGGSTLKADGPTGTSNVGTLHANFEWAGGDAQVNLVHSVAGDTRPIYAAGIIIDNADSITVDAGASSAVIDHIGGDDVSDLVFVSGANVTIVDTLALPGLSIIDGSDIVGNFTLTLGGTADSSGLSFDASAGTTTLTLDDVSAGTHSSFVATDAATFNIVVSGATDLAKATLTNVDGVSLGVLADLATTAVEANSVTLSISQVLVDLGGAANITLTHPGLSGTLNLTNLGGEEFKSTDLGAGVTLGTVTIAAGTTVLDTDTVLKGGSVIVAKGSTLTLTADQYMALTDLDGAATGTGNNAVINITGLTQAHITAGFTLTKISNASGTVSLASDVNLAPTVGAVLATNLNGFGVALAEGQTLGLATQTQADGLKVVGAANTTINLLFTTMASIGTPPSPDIDASKFDVDTLRFPASLVVNANIDDVFDGLLPRVEKVVYSNTVTQIDQTVTISAGAVFPGNLVLDRVEDNKELEDVVLNLQGGTEIRGNVELPAGADAAVLIKTYLKTLTINSTGTTANAQTGETDNVITGNIAGNTATPTAENELLDVTINAAQDLTIGGTVVFTAVVNNDEVATLTVTGAGNVSIGQLSTQDEEVDGLNVVNNGTGTLSVGISATNIDQPTDELSFTGTGDIVLTVSGTVDLSDDVLSAVSQIKLSNSASLTLSMAQAADELGEANIVLATAGTTATLNLNNAGSEEFKSTELGAGVKLGTVAIAAGTVVLDADTVLKGGTVTVAAGSTLTLSADQFMALADLDGILPVAPASTKAVINITGLTQAHITAGFTLANVSNVTGTVSLAENVNLAATTNLNGFGVALAEGQTLGLATAVQAEGLKVVGAANTTINLLFSSIVGTTGLDIDASGFNVDKLRFLDSLVANANIDDVFDGLLARVVKEAYNNTVALIDQTVNISAGTFFRGNVIADRAEQGTELEDFVLNLQGGTVVQGFVNLPASTETAGLVQTYLKTLTINSTGTTANPQTGSTANIITGNITAGADGSSTPGNLENELLDVTINAEQTLSIGGSIVFTSKVNNNEVASLEVTGTANVTIVDLNSQDDDVDGVNVVNSGTGTLSVGINAANIDSADKLSFTGSGDIVLTVTGNVDLSNDILTAVSQIKLAQGATLKLTMDQADDLGAANIVLAPGATAATLNLAGLSDQEFALADYAPGITVALLSLANLPSITLHPDTDLTGIGGLVVFEGTVLNMTAKQFQQLTGNGAITGVKADGTTVTTNYTVNITGLTQADVSYDLNGDGDSNDANETFILTGVTADNATLTMAESVTLQVEDSLAKAVGKFDVIIGNDMTLTLADIQQANGLNISGGTNTTLKFTDIVSGAFESIDASGFDVDTLMMLNQLVADRNVDLMFFGLQQSVTKVIYTGFGWVEGVNQFVEIEEGVTVPGFLVFNKPEADVEIRNFTLTMNGGTEIESNLRLSASNLENNLLQMDLRSVTINSVGTADDPLTDYVVEGTNRFTGKKANIIGGDITSQGTGPQGTYTSVDNNLLNVTINASEELIVEGAIVFESVTGNDNITANDNDAATATLNVTGTAAVTIGDLDTDDDNSPAADDVDFLVVNHTGTGALTFGLSSNNTVDATDHITVNGSATAMDTIVITGDLDLSDDILIEVDAIKLNNAGNPVELTLSMDQVIDIGLTNITAVDSVLPFDPATLHIVGFDDTEFDATEAVAPVTIGTITMAAGTWTLHPDTDLTGVTQIIVPEGGTLKLTAAQFNQLADAGSIIGDDTNGDLTIDEFFVEIYDLMQSDIANDLNGDGDSNDTFPSPLGAEAFDISDIVGATITIKLGEPTVELALDTNLGNLANLEVILAAGETLGLASEVQADGLAVTGGANSTVIFQYAPHTAYPGQIDASGYNITTLKALASGFTTGGNSNVEYSIDDLPSSVELRLYEDPADLGFLDPTFRRVVIEAGITTPSGLVFNDWDEGDEVRTLTLTLLGDVELNGNLSIPTRTDKVGDLVQQFFDLLTINSVGALPNKIDGSINTVTVLGNPNTSENNLTKVVVNATQPLVVVGDIVFRSTDDQDFPAANLTVTGTANVTVEQLNVTDPDLSILNVTNNGTGVLTVTGSSPAILDYNNNGEVDSSDPNLETLTFSGSGKIVIGDSNFLTTHTAISLASLSVLDASGMTGELVIGEITDVDSADFTFTSGTGKTTLTLTSDTLDSNGVDTIPNNTDDTLGWVFDFSNAGVGSAFHLGGGAPLVFVPGSNLSIDLGPNTTLYIDSSMDLSDLDLSILGGLPIVLADGAVLTLTAQQANGLDIIAGPDTGAAGITAVVNIVDLMNDTPALPPIDLSGVAANIAGTITLFTNDVTLDPLSNLGFFSVTLTDLGETSATLAGQTIRFQTVAQAERAILISQPGFPPADSDLLDSSTNVVWLFTSIPNPLGVDTAKYSAALGRLWFTDDLLANEGGLVESLFTTLPSTILRVDFADVPALNALLVSQPVNRIMEFVNYTTVGNLTYSDIGLNPQEHLQSLTLKLGGSATIGNVIIDDVVAPGTNTALIEFDFLTIESHRAMRGGQVSNNNILASETFKNDNDGTVETGETGNALTVTPDINTVGNIGVGPVNGLNLLVVNLDTLGLTTVGDSSAGSGAKLNVGTITYGYVPTVAVPIETAEFNVDGDNDINVTSVNTSDADIQYFGVDSTGFTAVLNAPGASPAFNLDNTEELTFTNSGVGQAARFTITADGTDDSNETLTINYLVNGIAATPLVVSLGAIDSTDAEAVAIAVAAALDGLAGITASADGNVVLTRADGHSAIGISSIVVGGTTDGLGTTITADEIEGGTINLGRTLPTVNAGIQGNTLSKIDAGTVGGGFDGVLNLGVINDVDGTDDVANIAFTMIAGDGVTTATLGAANGRAATLATGSTWSFTYTGADLGSALTISNGAVLQPGSNLVFNDVPVVIKGDVNLTLVNLDFNTIVDGCTIWVPAGQILRLTIEQLMQGDMVDITGEGTVVVSGDATGLTGDDIGFHLHTKGVDISGVTLIVLPAVGGEVAPGVVELNLYGAIGDANFGQGPEVAGPGHNVIGSAYNDLIDIDPLGAGPDQDDTVSAGLGNDTILGGYGSNTYLVTSGTDTLGDLYGDDATPLTDPEHLDSNDILVVSAGATALGEVWSEGPFPLASGFTATAATINNGTAVLTNVWSGEDMVIDVSLAGGTNGFTLIGSDGNTTGLDRLIGSSKNDTINGGNTDQTSAAAIDIMTGGAGADLFIFDITISDPVGAVASAPTVVGNDDEIWDLSDTGLIDDDGNQFITVTYREGNGNGIFFIADDASIDFNDLDAVGDIVAAELSTRGLATTYDIVTDQLLVNGAPGQGVEILSISAPGLTAAEAATSDDNDVEQENTVTIGDGTAGAVTIPGEIYRIVVTPDDGDSITAEYVADGTETESSLAFVLGLVFNSVAATVNPVNGVTVVGFVPAVPGVSGAVLTLQDQYGDNGGYTMSVSASGGVSGTGASQLLTGTLADLATADIVTDFATGTDDISFGLVAGTGGVSGNFDSAAEVALDTYVDVFNDAVAAMSGTNVVYYLGSIQADMLGNGTETTGLLFFDANNDDTPDGVVVLVGVDASSFTFSDIIA